MAIEFPKNIDDYTDGELWFAGVDESIARRLLFSLDKVDIDFEMWDRKQYLAHWYCERGDYRLAINLCRQLLMENGADKDALILMQYCCANVDDFAGLSEVLRAVKELPREDEEILLDSLGDTELASVVFKQEQRKKDVKVEFKRGWVEYYKKGELIYKFYDNDYNAFNKDHAAMQLLGEGDAMGAIAVLDGIKFSHLKSSTILLCEHAYGYAFMELGEYGKAFEHCQAFIKAGIYIDFMLPLLIGLKESGRSEEYDILRRYVTSIKHYNIYQLKIFFDYSEDTADFDFWDDIEKNNPLEELRENDERLCLQGRSLERKGDIEGARKRWLRARALYGQFSGANCYLLYPEIFALAEQKDKDESVKTLAARCREVMMTKLQELANTKPNGENSQEYVSTLSVALVDFVLDLDELSTCVYKIYGMDHLPSMSEINRLVTCEDVSEFNKAVCLANYLIYSKRKKIFFCGAWRRNLAAELKGKNQEVKYGVAMFMAHALIAFNDGGKELGKLNTQVKKIYSLIDWDKYQGEVKAYAVYGALLYAFSGIRLPESRVPNFQKDVERLAQVFFDNGELIADPKFGELYRKIIFKLIMLKDGSEEE